MSGFTIASAISAVGVGLTAASDFGLFGKSSAKPNAPPPLPPAAAPASLASVAESQTGPSNVKGAIGAGFDNSISTTPLGTTSPTSTATGMLGAS